PLRERKALDLSEIMAHVLAAVGEWRQAALGQRDHRLRLLDANDLRLWDVRKERQFDQPGAEAKIEDAGSGDVGLRDDGGEDIELFGAAGIGGAHHRVPVLREGRVPPVIVRGRDEWHDGYCFLTVLDTVCRRLGTMTRARFHLSHDTTASSCLLFVGACAEESSGVRS